MYLLAPAPACALAPCSAPDVPPAPKSHAIITPAPALHRICINLQLCTAPAFLCTKSPCRLQSRPCCSHAPCCYSRLRLPFLLQQNLSAPTKYLCADFLLQPDPAAAKIDLAPHVQPTERDGRPASFRVSVDLCINRRRLLSYRGFSIFSFWVSSSFVKKKKEKQKTEIRKREKVLGCVVLVLPSSEYFVFWCCRRRKGKVFR
ncbi:hypothetical protein SLEP1_g54976 [Rubroshorea leprosula]|uniref:Uncharacterized protein n=1 Tax=Rubroshorea leprosula TaxID=152421 RepID=A0AAV5MGK3_9ROSI|nr:hypothetical protein SLEP1_g54976 [Rubroshorea leprosula]